MVCSPIRVFPEPVGAQTTTERPAFRAAMPVAEIHQVQTEIDFLGQALSNRDAVRGGVTGVSLVSPS